MKYVLLRADGFYLSTTIGVWTREPSEIRIFNRKGQGKSALRALNAGQTYRGPRAPVEAEECEIDLRPVLPV